MNPDAEWTENPSLTEEIKTLFNQKDEPNSEQKLRSLLAQMDALQQSFRRTSHLLGERTKELSYLYRISDLVTRENISEKDFFQELVNLIPQAWQYPESTCARIVIDKEEFKSENFRKTDWIQSSEIKIKNKPAGQIEVCYLENKPEEYEGPFLKEERSLIDSIAAKAGEFMERNRIARELHESHENLRVTLQSLGDAVIATDTKGFITRMNPMAETLTGWKFSEAKGKKINDIFHIVNAFTGHQIKNPVDKVLQTGKIEGLANHTKLISKNGKEYQIADSGAPIKNDMGKITGVVLVFRDVTEEYGVQKKLYHSRELLQCIVEHANSAVAVFDDKMNYIYVSRKFMADFRVENMDLIGKNHYDMFPDLSPDVIEAHRKALQGTVTRNDRGKYIHPDGSVEWTKWEVRPWYETEEKIGGIILYAEYITEQVKAEEQIRESERRLNSLVENLPGFVYRCKYDENWTMLFLSSRFEKITGYPTTDFIENARQTFNNIIEKEFQPQIFKKWETAVNEHAGFEAEYRMITADGKPRWVHERGAGVYTGDGKLLFLEGYIEDITQRKKYEKELKESEERFRLVMENSLDAILITKIDGSILNANEAACNMFQMTEEEIIQAGRNGIVNLNDPNLPKMLEERKTKGYSAGELTFFRKGGTLFHGDISSSVFKNSQGETRTSMIIRDITERKKMEEKLRNSDRIFEHSVDMMSVSGFDGYFKTLNPAWERTLGWSTEELLSKPWNDFVHPDDIEATNSIKGEIVDGRTAYRFENRYRCKDGSYRWLSWNAFPYTEENVMFAVARDITESKKNEAILRESEQRFSIAFQASPAPLVISEIETGLFVDVNDRWVEMLGFSKEEQIGKTSKDVGIWHNPSERDRVIQLIHKNGFFKNEYIEFNTKSGEVILALWSAETIMHSGKKLMLSMIHDITARVKAENELRRLKENLEEEVEEKTQELRQRISELERFQEATIEREFRIKELREEIEKLKSVNS
jgi:PAS domain S-box-containing protein